MSYELLVTVIIRLQFSLEEANSRCIFGGESERVKDELTQSILPNEKTQALWGADGLTLVYQCIL